MLEHKDKGERSMVRFLSDEGVRKIHEQSLVILEDIGVEVMHDGGLAMLQDAGAKVDHRTKMVKLPADLVERCIAQAPKKITLGARNPQRDLVLEVGGKTYSRNGGGIAQILDVETREVRDILLSDVIDYTRLIDGLDNIDYAAAVYATDVPARVRDIRVLESMFGNTEKHINVRLLSVKSLPYIIKMAEIVAGSKEQLKKRPLICFLESPMSPLRFPDVLVETLIVAGEYGIPVELCSMPMAGASGPITLSGDLLVCNAEMLAAIVVSQVAHPAAPLEFCPREVIMDMSTGVAVYASIEKAMLQAAGAQMAAEHYGIPVTVHGPMTDSWIPDGQSLFERTYCTFLSAFAGATVLAGAGDLHAALAVSPIQLVIDDEIHGVLNRALEGFETSDDVLGVDAIFRAGVGGNYLVDKHTLKYLRSERYVSHLQTAEAWDSWTSTGSRDFNERAKRRMQMILEEHQVAPLDENVAKMLRELVQSAERELE